MSFSSTIEWTESTWNPITGCTKVSEGCDHCYAERLAYRLKAMGNPRYKNGFRVTIHDDLFSLPLKWKSSKIIFVNSMSDLFHKNVPQSAIEQIFKTMSLASQHCFQVLTKRSNRLLELNDSLVWKKNIWMGVTVESGSYAYRIDRLRQTAAKIKFLSLEPLLSPLPNLNLENIDWVIVGGESGPGARPIKPSWVRDIRDQCLEQGVPFFFKQWGGFHKKKAGRKLDRRTWNEMPKLPFASTE